MGFDPMTHQPKTNLVSTLLYLLALTNMTDLMDHLIHHKKNQELSLLINQQMRVTIN